MAPVSGDGQKCGALHGCPVYSTLLIPSSQLVTFRKISAVTGLSIHSCRTPPGFQLTNGFEVLGRHGRGRLCSLAREQLALDDEQHERAQAIALFGELLDERLDLGAVLRPKVAPVA